jgi:hypothetical protein
VQSELHVTISRELGMSEFECRKIVHIMPVLRQTLSQSWHGQRASASAADTVVRPKLGSGRDGEWREYADEFAAEDTGEDMHMEDAFGA